MTYCVAINVSEGLVFVSDSRTNAGVDHVNTYPKMFRFHIPGRAFFVICASGNLATTQALMHRIGRDLDSDQEDRFSLADCADVADAARYVGALNVEQRNYYEKELDQGANFGANLLIGGQVQGSGPEIYMVYAEGNYIQSSPYTPFLQIGETKYGKPILDRVIRHETSLEDAAKCALVSMDSTIRSNLSVAPPIDILVYRKDAFEPTSVKRLVEDSPYYATLRSQWGAGLIDLFNKLPHFDQDAGTGL